MTLNSQTGLIQEYESQKVNLVRRRRRNSDYLNYTKEQKLDLAIVTISPSSVMIHHYRAITNGDSPLIIKHLKTFRLTTIGLLLTISFSKTNHLSGFLCTFCGGSLWLGICFCFLGFTWCYVAGPSNNVVAAGNVYNAYQAHIQFQILYICF